MRNELIQIDRGIMMKTCEQNMQIKWRMEHREKNLRKLKRIPRFVRSIIGHSEGKLASFLDYITQGSTGTFDYVNLFVSELCIIYIISSKSVFIF